MLLAATEISPSAEFFGYFVAAVIVLLAAGATIKQIIEKRADKEAVPRKDFDELKVQVTTAVTGTATLTTKLTEYVTRTELATLRTELTQQLEKIDKYSRGRNHKLTEKVSELQLSMEALHRNIQAEIAGMVGKLIDKQERMQTLIAEMRTMIDRRLPSDPSDPN